MNDRWKLRNKIEPLAMMIHHWSLKTLCVGLAALLVCAGAATIEADDDGNIVAAVDEGKKVKLLPFIAGSAAGSHR